MAGAPPLAFEVIENALLVPSPKRTVYRDIDGAVFDAELRPVEASFLTRTWTRGQITLVPNISRLDLATADRVEAPHVYGGYFFDHFGHFLLESLARTWVAEEVGPMPFAWAAGDPPNRWQAEILSLLGLTGAQFFPRRPTLFRRLLVPEPGYRIQGQFHPRHARFLARHATGRTGSGEGRVWLSRSRVDPARRSRGEEVLQDELAQRGWRIVHPQALPVRGQLDVLSRASVVAGLEGSALHAAILLAGPAAPVIALRRTLNANYAAIAAGKGIAQFDLYGAYRIHDRKDVSLVAPRQWAAVVDGLAGRVEACADDPVGRAALKARSEAEHDFAGWERRQRRRLLVRGRAWLRAHKPGRRLHRMIRRQLPW